MSDSLLPLFLKKVSELSKVDDDKLRPAIAKLESWLAGNRSLIQHRACQAFLTYLWQSYGDDYKTREGFVSYVKYKVGYTDSKKLKTVSVDALCPHCRGDIKEKAYLKEFKVKSLSFADCSQSKHNEVFKQIQEFAMVKWGVPFDAWYEEWANNQGTLL